MECTDEQIDALKDAVVGVFGRTLDAPTDFDALSSEIQKKTGEAISPSTLKRLYGYIKSATAPRPSTLSTLARYAGCAGWSDFCEVRCGRIDASPKRNSYRAWLYYVLIGVGICILIIFLLRFAGAAPAESDIGSVQSIFVAETPDQKAVRIKRRCVAFVKEHCDSIRNFRSEMDIIAYKEAVDDFYYPFVFTDVNALIDKEIAEAFPDDEMFAAQYRNEIFELCQDMCIELMREIPADELTKAYREKLDI